MPSVSDWKIPASAQPKPEDYGYDLDQALASVVGLRTIVPADAFTAETLGTERAGHGVFIRDNGLVLTIGYLITEAETIWITLSDGRRVLEQRNPRAGDRPRRRRPARRRWCPRPRTAVRRNPGS